MQHYFNTEIYTPQYEKKEIENLLVDDMTLIVGDFWGIQSFIFERLSTKNAAKVLRSKSAYVQIITEVVAHYICHTLQIEEKYILTTHAGKFEILVPHTNLEMGAVQKILDDYFIENFYGLSGIVLSTIPVTKERWHKDYRTFRDEVAKSIEEAKFHKFNLTTIEPILTYDEGITNQTLCKICNIRKREGENCKICDAFITLGKNLTKRKQQHIDSAEIGIVFEGWSQEITLNSRLKSYIPKQEKYDAPLDFETIAKQSCGGHSNVGLKALGIIKADVDNMGQFIKQSDITDSFENFDAFSKGLDAFFSLYVPQLLHNTYPHIYTVFAGGDDLFLIGAWDEVMVAAREIQKKFKQYIYHEKTKLSISFGIAIAKPSTPVSFLANHTEGLLEHSKEVEGKDALTLWHESVKWDTYLKVFHQLQETFQAYQTLETTTIYRFLHFCNMSKRVQAGDVKATMWKSKLNYLFSRNLDIQKDATLMEVLSVMIENHPSETKLFLNEFVYQRRASL